MQEKRGIGYFYFQERYEYEYLHLDALNQIDGKPLLFRISIPPTPPPPPPRNPENARVMFKNK